MSDSPESNDRTPDGRFLPGCAAGPGRPRKAVRAAADALDERLAQDAASLYDLAFRLAQDGNETTLNKLLDRVWPIRRQRPLEMNPPEINGTSDVLPAMASVSNAMFAGDATPEESAAAARVLKAHAQAIELIDLEKRLYELEEQFRDRK